ncbi:STAS domain-containing protein [Amantichitinum ursilacus]|uniref:STAS domain protein n=1 Tax=Amantichitinum ursilacus TaxID=857265 RepID=A0A0N0GR51_9NEIS|nr:STAS domain-containing protein [Amantichitinum ursilacus]KPC55109.1 STAS domain protein [Amantichitinum ursilacus]
MPLRSENDGPQGTLHIEGEFNIYQADQLKPLLLAELSAMENITVDLAQVEEIDTAGIQLLLMLKQEAARQQKAISFINHSKPVLEVFELCNLGGHFGDPMIFTRP